jgi:hypothetical protein
MSKYSQKRQTEMPCAADAECLTLASRIVVIRGIPTWACERHWEERQPKKSR